METSGPRDSRRYGRLIILVALVAALFAVFYISPLERKRRTDMSNSINILFLCTHNANRSQMAEGWTNHLRSGKFKAFSAGIEPSAVDPRATKVMGEAGVDISAQESKGVESLGDTEFDYVVTLCPGAADNCPYFPARTRVVHRGFDDPPSLAAGETTEEGKLSHYRRIRDEIRGFVEGLPDYLG